MGSLILCGMIVKFAEKVPYLFISGPIIIVLLILAPYIPGWIQARRDMHFSDNFTEIAINGKVTMFTMSNGAVAGNGYPVDAPPRRNGSEPIRRITYPGEGSQHH